MAESRATRLGVTPTIHRAGNRPASKPQNQSTNRDGFRWFQTRGRKHFLHFLEKALSDEILDGWIKRYPRSRLPPFTKAEVEALQASWVSYVSTTMTPGALALSTLKEFYQIKPEMLEMKDRRNPAAIQELANVFGAMLNLVVKNLNCQRSVVRYVIAYDVERQKEDTPTSIIHMNEFYKIFVEKFLKSREEQNDFVNLWSVFFDRLFRLTNWQYIYFYYELFDESILIRGAGIRKCFETWKSIVEAHSLESIILRTKGHLHLVYPEVEAQLLAKSDPSTLEDVVQHFVGLFNVFVDDFLRNTNPEDDDDDKDDEVEVSELTVAKGEDENQGNGENEEVEDKQQRQQEKQEERAEEEEEEEDEEEEEEEEEKTSARVKVDQFFEELFENRGEMPLLDSIRLVSMLSYSIMYSLRSLESVSPLSRTNETRFKTFFSFWIRCCDRRLESLISHLRSLSRKRERKRRNHRREIDRFEWTTNSNKNADEKNAENDDDAEIPASNAGDDDEVDWDKMGAGFAALTPSEVAPVLFFWRRVICGGGEYGYYVAGVAEEVATPFDVPLRSAGSLVFAEVLQKAPDLAKGIVGDAFSLSTNVLANSKVQTHIWSLIQLMSTIIGNLHRQEELPQHLRALVDFFTIWNYGPVEVDLILKAFFNIMPQYLPREPREGLAHRFYQSWRKFLSFLGKWYKSLSSGDLLLLEEPGADGSTADILKDDYDVAGSEIVAVVSDYSPEEGKVLFSSWKMLEGITKDGIKYKLGPGAEGGSHQLLGAVVFMYLFRSDPDLRYKLLPNLNHLSNMALLRSSEVLSYSLRLIDEISDEIDAVAAVSTGRRNQRTPVRVGDVRRRLSASLPRVMMASAVEEELMDAVFDAVNRGLSVKGVDDPRIRIVWRKFLSLD